MPRVLLVEPDEAVRQRMFYFLSTYGLEVVTATTAHEAAVLYDDCRPDVVVISADLPDADGVHLARQFVISSPRRVVLTTAATGSRWLEVREAGREVGQLNIFRKPIVLDTLRRRISLLLLL